MGTVRLNACARRVLTLVLLCASCAAPARVLRQRAPLVQPVEFRVETVLFDLPLDRARSIATKMPAHDDGIGWRLDEEDLKDRLTALAQTDETIRLGARENLVAGALERRRVPPRVLPRAKPLSIESDQVEISVRVARSEGWQICDLEVELAWLRAWSSPLRASPSTTQMPPDLWLEFDMLPASGPRAIIGFVRAVPIWPETGDL
jgi:hypothetical protein